MILQEDGQKCTPLIIAARYGHQALVKMLIDKFHINLESEGTVKDDGINITEGVTALWCAAGTVFNFCFNFNSLKKLIYFC